MHSVSTLTESFDQLADVRHATVVRPWADPSPTAGGGSRSALRELDRHNSTQLGRDVLDALNDGRSVVVLDCTSTGYISSYGLATIVRLAKLVREHGRRFIVVGLNADLVDVFERVKLDQIVETCNAASWISIGGAL